MGKVVASIPRIVLHAIFQLMVIYTVNWQLCEMAFVVLCVVRRKGRLPCYFVTNDNVDSIWHVWHPLFQLFLLKVGFALFVENLLAMSNLVTKAEDFFSVFHAFCGEIVIQFVDASCGFKHQWRLTKEFDIKNRRRRLKMGLTLHPTYSPLVTSLMACSTHSICTILTWMCIVVCNGITVVTTSTGRALYS